MDNLHSFFDFFVRNNGHISNDLWVIYVHYFPLATDLEYVKKILTVLLMSLRIILPPKNGALFELGKVLVRKMPKIDIFGSCRLSSISVFLTIDGIVKTMQWGCQSYGMGLSELCFEAVRCHKWASQSIAMRASDNTYDHFRCGEWGKWSGKDIFPLRIWERQRPHVPKR